MISDGELGFIAFPSRKSDIFTPVLSTTYCCFMGPESHWSCSVLRNVPCVALSVILPVPTRPIVAGLVAPLEARIFQVTFPASAVPGMKSSLKFLVKVSVSDPVDVLKFFVH